MLLVLSASWRNSRPVSKPALDAAVLRPFAHHDDLATAQEVRRVARSVIIGDVHGMRAALAELLGQLGLGEGDILISAGDLVDKGPDPAGVVHDLARLRATAPFRVVLVEGNHEERHRRYRANLSARPAVARKQAEDSGELPGLTASLSDEGRAFLNAAVPFHRLPQHDVLVVHGGIPGNMRQFPETVAAAQALSGKERDKFLKVLRTRYVDRKTGRFIGLGDEAPDDPFWADVYDGRFGHVVFGHHPFMEGPARFPHATGIDTGAVHGGGLTAMILQADGARQLVTVPTPVYAPRRSAPAPADR